MTRLNFYFGFKDRTSVQTVTVPGYCFHFTLNTDRFYQNINSCFSAVVVYHQFAFYQINLFELV